MSDKPTKRAEAVGVINPEFVYTADRAAIILGITPRTLREQFINTGKLMAMPLGKSYLVPGYAIADLVAANLQICAKTAVKRVA